MTTRQKDFLAYLFCAALPAAFLWLFLKVWLG